MDQKTFNELYAEHLKYLDNFRTGTLMNISYDCFENSDFINLDLRGMVCYDTSFVNCNFTDVSLDFAQMEYNRFVNCTFTKTQFWRTNLADAEFRRCVFSDDVTFFKTILINTDFKECKIPHFGCGVCIAEATFSDTEYPENFIPQIVPDTGSFTGWKKAVYSLNGKPEPCLIKLEIPADAKRINSTGRKCRCDKAKVLGFYSQKGESLPKVTSAVSVHDRHFVYKIGKIVHTKLDENKGIECSQGIHFFITKREAMDYQVFLALTGNYYQMNKGTKRPVSIR